MYVQLAFLALPYFFLTTSQKRFGLLYTQQQHCMIGISSSSARSDTSLAAGLVLEEGGARWASFYDPLYGIAKIPRDFSPIQRERVCRYRLEEEYRMSGRM